MQKICVDIVFIVLLMFFENTTCAVGYSFHTIAVPMQTSVSMETLGSDTANTHAFVTSALIFIHCSFSVVSCSSCSSGSVHVHELGRKEDMRDVTDG